MVVHYFMLDEQTMRVQGFGTVDGEVWDAHQQALKERPAGPLRMVPIFDLAQLDMLRAEEPHNVQVNAAWMLEPVPEAERNKVSEIIVVGDDRLMLLNEKMDRMIALLENLPATMAKAMIEGMK